MKSKLLEMEYSDDGTVLTCVRQMHLLDVTHAESSIDMRMSASYVFLAFSENLTCDKTFPPYCTCNLMTSYVVTSLVFVCATVHA